MTLPLGALLSGHSRLVRGDAGAPISAITADSRKVGPGTLFVAIPGTKADGTRFIPDAVARGAGAVLMEPTGAPPAGEFPLAFTLNARRALALGAARLYPRQPQIIAAVTGTAGKTSVAFFLRHIFAHLGRRAAYLGTLGLIGPEGAVYGGLTSPDPVDLHETLDRLAATGVTHMALEASSHGLDQFRLDGVCLSAGGFTNLGRDHLDYHPTVEAYYRAKLRLFTDLLPEGAPAVAVRTAPYGADTLAVAFTRGLRTFAIGPAGDIDVVEIVPDGAGQRIRLAGGRDIALPLIGAFQADNALLAAGLALALGEAAEPVFAALATLPGVPGRMERVGRDPDRLVFVDYAHKPEALAAVLDTLRPAVPGRLVCLFGCGGDRDRGKRPLMGAIAAARADVVIVTDDNPRSEDPAAIRAEILAAAPGALDIADRAAAIDAAVRMLQPGDALVVAGKGHETGQIVGDRILPFSDAAAVLAALGEQAP
ncbi:UDP-N-acetylmuramoyl-L-alanyl-D-glutamate--2,6-diaminopimelate ligase [Aquabacter spiritensis]|uniref:UDP-N-acetylmuramoyl-L-alanyl-D-glutamate--2,6-diaminopimelate ligase n=1 Tax=Aquabacter spiritensis TaxID=933073 RepID=A0A4V2UYA5_9HYPH|nr:UDP-N-acetylmuramoyl-L-alanyl-D-glutamate--2,6-diaminopimelate ligase [Aquabacter spiritensis]TCT06648.1 UDP-N-acetylmuramoylalanyl-D-glutamate--2,6-diaminopimelate ligase [Aquabacter spiritensis]